MKIAIGIGIAILLAACLALPDSETGPADSATRGVIVGYIARHPVYRLTDVGFVTSCYAYRGNITCVRGRP